MAGEEKNRYFWNISEERLRSGQPDLNILRILF